MKSLTSAMGDGCNKSGHAGQIAGEWKVQQWKMEKGISSANNTCLKKVEAIQTQAKSNIFRGESIK